MELKDIQEVVNDFIREDAEHRGVMVLACDNQKCMTLGTGKRGDLVRLLYQMLLSDEKEEFVSCMDEAMRLFMQKKKEQTDSKIVQFPIVQTKYKS